MITFAIVLVLWLLLNWLAPLTLLIDAKKMSLGRLPKELVDLSHEQKITFYTGKLTRGLGFSTSTWPRVFVVFDAEFMRHCTPSLTRFVIAHEIGHCVLGHLRERYLLTVSGFALLPAGKARLLAMENEADDYATKLTGFKREFFKNHLVSAGSY